ncbi:hypothetical protein BASH2_03406 [Bacillus anthracis]|nr:hypothetical protein BASH2_03406 [Bacillus anthracis]
MNYFSSLFSHLLESSHFGDGFFIFSDEADEFEF